MKHPEDELLIEEFARNGGHSSAVARILARMLPTTTFEHTQDIMLPERRVADLARRILRINGRIIDEMAYKTDSPKASGLISGGTLNVGPTILHVDTTATGERNCRVRISAVSKDSRLNWPSARLAVEWLIGKLMIYDFDPSMHRLAFTGSDGEYLHNPNLEDIRGFFKLGTEYWEGQSGSAWLGWLRYDGDKPASASPERFDLPCLQIMRQPDYGVHIIYSDGETKLTLLDDSLPEGEVKYYVGGEPERWSRRSFVSLEMAEQVIKEFLQSQTPSASRIWATEQE